MSFKLPASIAIPVGDAIHKALFKEARVLKGVITPKQDSPNVFDPTSANSSLEYTNDRETKGMKSVMAKIRTEGISKTNLFLVNLESIPSKLDKGALDEDYLPQYDDASFFSSAVESVSFPGINYLTTEYRKYGMMTKVPYLRDYQEVTIVFRCNGSMWERKFFDAWIGLISNNSSLDFRFKDDYVTGISIIQLDQAFRHVYAQQLFNAYPIHIAAMDSAYHDENNYQRVAVTFAYDFAKQKQWLDDEKTNDMSDGVDISVMTPTPNFPSTKSKVKGVRGKSPIDQVMDEILKQGQDAIGNKIIKRLPVGNIPGIGPLSSLGF